MPLTLVFWCSQCSPFNLHEDHRASNEETTTTTTTGAVANGANQASTTQPAAAATGGEAHGGDGHGGDGHAAGGKPPAKQGEEKKLDIVSILLLSAFGFSFSCVGRSCFRRVLHGVLRLGTLCGASQ